MLYNATITSRFEAGDALPEGAAANETYIFNDRYTVDGNRYDDQSARAFIRRDLLLVAGGGYDPIDDKNIISLVITREG